MARKEQRVRSVTFDLEFSPPAYLFPSPLPRGRRKLRYEEALPLDFRGSSLPAALTFARFAGS